MQVVFKVLSFVGNPVAEVPGIARGILKIVQHTPARAEMTNMSSVVFFTGLPTKYETVKPT